MPSRSHLALAAALGLATLTLTATPAQAQIRRAPAFGGTGVISSTNPFTNPYRVNPYQYIPGTTTTYQQYAYNQALLARAYASYPPWYYGYNPYPRVVNLGPTYPVYTPTVPYYNPYTAIPLTTSAYNPYFYGYGFGLNGVNPYFGP